MKGAAIRGKVDDNILGERSEFSVTLLVRRIQAEWHHPLSSHSARDTTEYLLNTGKSNVLSPPHRTPLWLGLRNQHEKDNGNTSGNLWHPDIQSQI